MSEQLPNILLITLHDLGQWLNCYDVRTVRPPHVDKLAADGIRFEQSFCVAPQCSPSRATLFTGRYPHSNGVMGLTNDPHAWQLNPNKQHLGRAFQAAGYAPALVYMAHETQCPISPRIAKQIEERCAIDEVVAGNAADSVTSEDMGRGEMLGQEAVRIAGPVCQQ
jgi:arylsulfatase A-like enzyme